MSEPDIISATEASRAFSDLLHRVCYGGESFIIKKGNRLMARIEPVSQVMEHTQQVNLAAPKAEEAIQEGPTDGAVEYFKTMVAQLNIRQSEDA